VPAEGWHPAFALPHLCHCEASWKEAVAISVRKPKVCEPCWRKPISYLWNVLQSLHKNMRLPRLNA